MKSIAITSAFVFASLASASPLLGTLNSLLGGNKGFKACDHPGSFTSAYFARAEPGQVIATDNSGVAPGEEGAIGRFAYYINAPENVICYDLRTEGVTGAYQSLAKTATHIHNGPKGLNGPPKIAFPNPEKVGTTSTGKELRKSSGCLKGPFTSGIKNNVTGIDTAEGFTLQQLQDDSSRYFGDTHTSKFVPGAVRGQLTPSERHVKKPKKFTSTLRAEAGPDNVVNATNQAVAGQKGAKGTFTLRINSDEDILCYDIVTYGVDGEYSSPAKTATHVHQSAKGLSGPPRLAFKNPVVSGLGKLLGSKKRSSSGCIQGPFSTGLNNATSGIDTGSASGFTLKALEANPAGFAADTHTATFLAGAIRGQLVKV